MTWSFIKKDLDRKKAEEEARNRGAPVAGAYRPAASYPAYSVGTGGGGSMVMGGSKVDKRVPIAGKVQQGGGSMMPVRPPVSGVKRGREEGGSEAPTPVPDSLDATPLPDLPKEGNGLGSSTVGVVEASMAGGLEGGGGGEEAGGAASASLAGRATRGAAKKA